MKPRKTNIIAEKYVPSVNPFAKWNADRFVKTTKTILKKTLDEDLLADRFDNVLVPKKWFSWKPVFANLKEDNIEVVGAGIKGGCKVSVIYEYELKDKEFTGLIFGDEKDEKYGGLIYNKEFQGALKDAGINTPSENLDTSDLDDSEAESELDVSDLEVDESIDERLFKAYRHVITEQAESLMMKVTFQLTCIMEPKALEEQVERHNRRLIIEQDEKKEDKKPAAEVDMKPEDYLNPNYLTLLKGNIVLWFNDVKAGRIGSIKIIPKRTKDMEFKLPYTLTRAISNLWSGTKGIFSDTMKNPATDFGIAGVAAKKMIGAPLSALGHSLTDPFKTVAKRRINVTIEPKFQYTANFKNAEDRENAVDDETSERNSDEYKANVKDKIEQAILSTNSSLKVVVNDHEDNGKTVSVSISNSSGMKILMFKFSYD